MNSKTTTSDIFDINRKTGALVLGKNRLDDYATKFLNKHFKQALIEPMALPVEEMIDAMGLTVGQVSLSRNLDIFGCCLLLDGHVEIYSSEDDSTKSKYFEAGTILIDPASEEIYGVGSRRNTLVHEAVHWEKDKRYFEILKIKNRIIDEDFTPIMCRQSQTFFEPPEGKKTKDNEIKWLEWQAHRITPRILMPKESFKRKALLLIQGYSSKSQRVSCDILIEDLSEFFITSRLSTKFRLLEVGLKEVISKFYDYESVYNEINSTRDFTQITIEEAFEMLDSNSTLQNWVRGGRYVFVDGYFVLASSQFVTRKKGVLALTSKDRKNLEKCVINIREQHFISYANTDKDFLGFATLKKSEGIDCRLLTFHPKFQTPTDYEEDEVYQAFSDELTEYNEEEEIELVKMIGDPTKSLCDCLWFLMKNRNWNYPEVFNEKTDLHKNYHGKIKNNKLNNMSKENLMALCVGLKLCSRVTLQVFSKSDNKLDFYTDPDKTWVRILDFTPGLNIQDFNGILEKKSLKLLGSAIKE